MRKLKFLSLFFCALAALSFTSCNDDDEDSAPTPEQIQQYYAATRGSHTGVLIYPKNPGSTSVNNNDTISGMRWEITSDSTMTIYSVPSKAIAAAVADSTLKKSIEAMPSQNIQCSIGYIKSSLISWLVNPTYITFDGAIYKGETHKVQIAFYTNNLYSFGQYNPTTGAMVVQILVGGGYVEGKFDNGVIRTTLPLTFYQSPTIRPTK